MIYQDIYSDNIFTVETKEGIATLTLNMTDYPANLLNEELILTYTKKAKALLEDNSVKGIIITSSKKDFVSGADLKTIFKMPKEIKTVLDGFLKMHKLFREIELIEKPIVSCINGTVLGGGFEFALTTKYRIATKGNYKIGLPETKFGLLPGAGGTIKSCYLMGIQKAVTNILQGKIYSPEEAKQVGYIDYLAENEEDMLNQAKKWINENPQAMQPWDNKSYKIPGGPVMSPSVLPMIAGAIANTTKNTFGNYPSAMDVLTIVYQGMQLPFDRALEVEARYFVKALQSKQAKHLIRTIFINAEAAKKGKNKPKGFEKKSYKKITVLGAGMMGAGIAFVSARAGIEVVLKDVTQEAANKGKAYSETLLQKEFSKGLISNEKMNSILDRIFPTDNYEIAKYSDLIVEAVFENQKLKAEVTKEVEGFLKPDGIFGSNTSTIPITLLSKAFRDDKKFIGIHFFSPVEKMPLVEIIKGKNTDEKTVAETIDFVTAINKYPIVVNDSRGFYTSRVFSSFPNEAILLLSEGVSPIKIENLAKNVGMPVGPLALMDEISFDIPRLIWEAVPEDQKRKSGSTLKMLKVFDKIAEIDSNRKGKKYGKGFYEYPKEGKKKIWEGLTKLFPSTSELDNQIITDRMIYRMVLESYRCFDEGVVNTVEDVDVGSVYALGFLPYTGGTLSYIDFVGIEKFINRCDELKSKFGDRFSVPQSLRDKANIGENIYND